MDNDKVQVDAESSILLVFDRESVAKDEIEPTISMLMIEKHVMECLT